MESADSQTENTDGAPLVERGISVRLFLLVAAVIAPFYGLEMLAVLGVLANKQAHLIKAGYEIAVVMSLGVFYGYRARVKRSRGN